MIVGGVGLLALAVVVGGLLYATGTIDDEITEGQQYHVVDGAPERTSGPIMVREFFSWACAHCRTLEPHLQKWRRTAADDVAFERFPVGLSPNWELLAHAWHTFNALDAQKANFNRMFVAIHDQRRSLRTPEDIAAVAVGVDQATFLDAWRSPTVRRALAASNQRVRDLGINSTPVVVVAHRYLIRASEAGSGQRLINVINYVIDLERQRRASPTAPGAPTGTNASATSGSATSPPAGM